MLPHTTFCEALRRKATPAAFAVAVVCALGLAFNIWMAELNQDGLGLDYTQFYTSSHLAGTGHMYRWDPARQIEIPKGLEVLSSRLPVVVYGHKILSGLPYPVARTIWMAVSIAALILFAAFWPGARPWPMLAALAWSMSATIALLFGQDVPFWLVFFTAGLLLMERKRPWSAGVVFALCLCKFHLALGIPVLLVAQKRFKTLIAGGITGAALIASCYLIEGAGWLQEYVRTSKVPQFSPAPERMPNLHGVAHWLPWPTAAEIVFAIAVVLLLWTACREGTDLATAGAAAVACGLLVGYHAYAADITLLIPLSVLTIQRPGVPPWLKIWAVAMLSPAPVLLLLSQRPFLAQIPLAAFVVTAVLFGLARPLSLAEPGPKLV
jgi:hypothetical protein